MSSTPTTGPPSGQGDYAFEGQLRDMNEALLVSSVRQHELTEQAEKAEAEMRASEERFRTLFELGPVAVYSCDASGVIQEFNRRAAELWRRAPAVGDTDERFCGSFKLFRPDGSFMPHDQCPMAEVVSGKIAEVRDAEVLIERPDGSRVIVVVNIRPLKNQRGELTGAINCFYDVSERKQAEQTLHDSEVRYRRLFESSQDGILILDAGTGRVIDANPFMTTLLGYAHDEFLGKELWEIGLFRDIKESQAAYRELQEKGYVRYEHLPLENRSGHKVEVEFISNVYAEDQHRVVQCSIRDITERSRLQRLTQEQAAALADLDHRKDEFLAMLSHELRNPLAPILNAALLLRLHCNRNRMLGIENPVIHQSASIIERQVGQLARIVDELLEVSRITTGRIQLQKERIAVGVMVENAVATVRSLIDQRKHELTVLLPTQAIWLHADAARLEQVVVNLLTNAAKYTDEGGHVWLTLQQEAEEAVLRVRDTGVGIAPEILPRIFDLFTQAARSLDRSQGGLGIGLALVQRLVEMHGGTVTASSVLGQGSEFVVRLPVVSPPEPQPSLPLTEKAQPTGPALRVLVVDDNVDTVTTLAMLVQESGHDVRTAFDGSAVLEAALDYRPNVVLLDIGLPGLNGFEVAKRLRQQPTLKNIVLVAMTGYGQESDRKRSQEAGFDHHLVKPGDFGKVLQVLATVSESQAR